MEVKIFDSHARDEYGRSHPSGTCVLLEVPSIQGLVQYFQTIHSLSDNYELRGVQISTYEVTRVNNLREEHNCSCKQCSAVGLCATEAQWQSLVVIGIPEPFVAWLTKEINYIVTWASIGVEKWQIYT